MAHPKPQRVVDRIIMGVDPGTALTGYGLLHSNGATLTVIDVGVIRLDKASLDHPQKLGIIFKRILQLIDSHHPDELAVEAPFYGKNPQSMLKLGRAQGVVMAAALLRQVPVVEYAPRRVKQSVTGRGTASKEQVKSMLHTLLPSLSLPGLLPLDATDALAVAMCHYLQRNLTPGQTTLPPARTSKGKTAAWTAFLASNPERVS